MIPGQSQDGWLRNSYSVFTVTPAGIYSRRLNLASGRFAMIDDGLGFSLVPWRPALERRLGQHVSGLVNVGGGVDWDFARQRGLGI